MEPTTYFLVFCVIMSLCVWSSKKTKGKQVKGEVIPGPTGFRNMTNFISRVRKNNVHHLALKLAEQYGDLVRVNVLSQNVVYINSAKLVRHLFNDPQYKEVTNDRTPSFISKYVVYGDKNVAFTPRTYQQQRRRKLFHSVLKFYGENVARFESIIQKSLVLLTKQIETQKSVEITKEISRATLRIVDILLAGAPVEGSERNVDVLEEFDTCFNAFFTFDNESILQMFPFLRFVPGLDIKRKYDALIKARDNLVQVYYYEHKKTYIPNQKRGIVDSLLQAKLQLEEQGNEFLIDDDVIKALLCETTIASYLTTSRTMNILILLLILNPKIQAKISAEVREIIGQDIPSMRHRSLMPYIESTILEVLRYATSGPFLLPHYTREDIVVDGFHIPKGSVLAPNAWYCHRREDVWENPWTFVPERFLDSEGQLLQADHPMRQNLFAFGTGSRSCPGEAFARSRLFLILTTLVQHFEFFALEGEKLPTADPREWAPASVLAPEDFRCGARLRGKR